MFMMLEESTSADACADACANACADACVSCTRDVSADTSVEIGPIGPNKSSTCEDVSNNASSGIVASVASNINSSSVLELAKRPSGLALGVAGIELALGVESVAVGVVGMLSIQFLCGV